MKKSNFIKSILSTVVVITLLSACRQNNNIQSDIESIKSETIAIHDEIMPQVGSFDRKSIKIDSILLSLDSLIKVDPNLDTAQIKQDLSGLKEKLEGATESMMQWMSEFNSNPENLSNEELKSYYEKELAKVKEMKKTFENVNSESTEKLARY